MMIVCIPSLTWLTHEEVKVPSREPESPARVLRQLNWVQSFFLRPDRPTPIAAPRRARLEITAVNPGRLSRKLSNPVLVSFPADFDGSKSESSASQIPSLSASLGMLEASLVSVPQASSSVSENPSSSSSVSALSPVPSPSVSLHSLMSYGNASLASGVLSASSSVSALSPTPSPS